MTSIKHSAYKQKMGNIPYQTCYHPDDNGIIQSHDNINVIIQPDDNS
jgi:aminopeptidase-like protein